MKWVFKIISFFIITVLANHTPAQQTQVYKPVVNRVLFVLDVSGSMNGKWNGKPKFEIAKELLYKLIDSVERKNPNVQFAVRAFGYQFAREQRNCNDSKLLVGFSKNNAERIKNALSKIRPQGMTPIAYSLQQSVSDFSGMTNSLNSIIIITDGNENCDGNPCEVSQTLLDKRISLRPFIVGLDGNENFIEKLNCVGTVLNVKDDASLYNTVGVIIRQTLNTTTTQINLLDINGKPTVTNIPFTLYDHASGKILYNFIHTLNEKGNPDTLYLDPVGVYDLELHTVPPIRKNNIELTTGKHNIIALDAPVGQLNVTCLQANYANNDAQVVVRQKNAQRKIINVQDLNATVNYLQGDYELEILTTPVTGVDTTLPASGEVNILLKNYGTVSFMASESYLVSIYIPQNSQLHAIERWEMKTRTDNRRLQPGSYLIVYKPTNSYDSELTRYQRIEIKEGDVAVINMTR